MQLQEASLGIGFRPSLDVGSTCSPSITAPHVHVDSKEEPLAVPVTDYLRGGDCRPWSIERGGSQLKRRPGGAKRQLLGNSDTALTSDFETTMFSDEWPDEHIG